MNDLEKMKKLLSMTDIGIWTIEMDEGKEPRMYTDEKMKYLLGITGNLSPEETYKHWYEKIHPDYYDSVTTVIDKIISGKNAEVTYPWHHPERGMVYVRCGGVLDTSYQNGIRFGGSHQDISNLLQFQKDSLTGLYSMEFFFQRVEEILAENPDRQYRIVVSDIENFKMINDKYGMEMGNQILKLLADSVRKCLPNFIIGSRVYADRFVFLQLDNEKQEKINRNLQDTIIRNSPIPNLTCKHGIYRTKIDRSIPAQAMYDRARIAVRSIKGVYGANFAFYDDKVRENLVNRQQILENMEEALAKHEFVIYLQPKHNLHTDKTGGAEALVRWIHPELGFMNPGIFIPLFEETGFITQLDEYIINDVCKLLNQWRIEGKPCVPISVNLSRKDFECNDLADQIISLLDSYQIPHELIHLEVTESSFSQNPDQIAETIQTLHDHGFVIELDDFGTGYSSLYTLSTLTFDVLKLDMSIIHNDKPEAEPNVLDFCTHLVKMMNLESVAEGVETKEQLDRLRLLGCDYIQGYYYSKPLPIKDFEEYLMKDFYG